MLITTFSPPSSPARWAQDTAFRDTVFGACAVLALTERIDAKQQGSTSLSDRPDETKPNIQKLAQSFMHRIQTPAGSPLPAEVSADQESKLLLRYCAGYHYFASRYLPEELVAAGLKVFEKGGSEWETLRDRGIFSSLQTLSFLEDLSAQGMELLGLWVRSGRLPVLTCLSIKNLHEGDLGGRDPHDLFQGAAQASPRWKELVIHRSTHSLNWIDDVLRQMAPGAFALLAGRRRERPQF